MREEAVIRQIDCNDERGCTVFVLCEGPGWGQSFGGMHLQDEAHRKMYIADLCTVFGVQIPELLIGKSCYALRCFRFGVIEGLESCDTGRRFILHDWSKQHWPEHAKDPLTRRLESLANQVRHADRLKEEALKSIETAASEYTKWSVD